MSKEYKDISREDKMCFIYYFFWFFIALFFIGLLYYSLYYKFYLYDSLIQKYELMRKELLKEGKVMLYEVQEPNILLFLSFTGLSSSLIMLLFRNKHNNKD